jgi:hypothetical protein
VKKLEIFVPLALAAALVGVWIVVFVAHLAPSPPLLSNEAEIMYEASRLARGLPLYTDPIRGAFDDGPLPIRHYVLYGPVAPWLLSLVPDAGRLVTARVVSVVAWFVGIPALAFAGRRESRVSALIVAFSYVGLSLLARDAVFFTLTPVPVVVAAVALVRVVHKGRLDVVSSLLFVLAWAMKPLVVGIVVGVALFTLLDRETPLAARVRALVPGALGLVVAVAALVLGTHGAWLVHLRASTDNGMLPLRWLHFTYEYFPVLGLPHLIVGAWLLRRQADRRLRITGWALVASTAWAIFAMGKRGANAGYFAEPTAALVLAVAFAEAPAERAAAWVARVAVVAAPLLAWGQSVRQLSELDHVDPRAEWATLARVRALCEREAPGRQVRAGLPAVELGLTGRVTLAPWQHALLVDRGAFPLDMLIRDLDRPELGCVVHSRALDGPAPPLFTDRGELTYFDALFDVQLREAIRSRFRAVGIVDQMHVYCRPNLDLRVDLGVPRTPAR